MSLQLEELINEAIDPFFASFTTQEMVEALRAVAEDLERDEHGED